MKSCILKFLAAVKVAWRFSHITKSTKFAVDEFCCLASFAEM